MSVPRPVMLIVLDGWGLREETAHNAAAIAPHPGDGSPFCGAASYASSHLRPRPWVCPMARWANSEVGHLNLGEGRVVNQDIVRIDSAIESGSFFENPAFAGAVRAAASEGGAVHISGLVSDGGVHSRLNHGVARRPPRPDGRRGTHLCPLPFMDGRDTPPTGGLAYLKEYAAGLEREAGARIATVSGAVLRDGPRQEMGADKARLWRTGERAREFRVPIRWRRYANPMKAK